MSLINHDQRDHLKLLRENGTDVAIDLCKLALDCINNGKNPKKQQTAAGKLNVSADAVQNAVNALVMLQVETIRCNVSEVDFSAATKNEFTPEQISVLWQFVTSKKEFISNILSQISVKDLRFRELEWRLEARIASRSLLQQAIPIITIKMHLDTEIIHENKDQLKPPAEESSVARPRETRKKQILFQTDPNNLIHIIDTLEKALEEAKTHRIRNIVKTV